MTAILGGAIIWQPDDFIFFKKCGEITISPDVQSIGFNCVFCSGICLQNDAFLQHLQEHHKEEVFKLYENQNFIILDDQALITNNLTKDLMVTHSNEANVNENLNSTSFTADNACINNNQLQECKTNQELKLNCLNLNVVTSAEGNLMPLADLNLVYALETNDLLALTPSNQDLENLITLNPHENNVTASNNSYSSTLIGNTVPTFPIPSNCNSSSTSLFKCLPDNKECEMADGEDSGIMLVQSPCHSDCGGLSDCMLFTEDSSSKSIHNLNENLSDLSAASKNLKQKNDRLEKLKNSSKGKYLKTTAMRKALNNKDLIKYLLEAYKKNEKLWNPTHPSYKYNAHRTVYNELSQPLLHDKKCSLTGEEIFGIIAELRGRYRRELKKFVIRKGKHKTRLWYFEKMEFLRHIIEGKRRQREKDYVDILNLKDNDLTNRQILSYILDLYRENECLWNPNHKDHTTCNKTEIHHEITAQLKKKLNISMTSAECMNEIQKLRIRYRKELRIWHKHKGRYMPKLWCFDEMEFLKPVMEEKITNNLKKINNRSLTSLIQKKQDFQNVNEIKFSNLEDQLKFIEIYCSYSSLWDVNHPDYRSTLYRRKALNEMLERVHLIFTKENQFQIEQLEKTIHLLRKDFSNEKLQRLTKNHLSKQSVMSFILYEKLSEFLDTNLGPFNCESCQRIYKTYDQFKIHQSQHDGTLPFICTLCGKGFQIPGNLTIHIRRHRRDFPYSCDICKKSFATSTEVSIHMRSHTGERPYACEWCDKTFKTWSFCDLHRRTHLNQSNFHCPICDKSFYERNRFTDHMNIHLNIRKHQCEQCGKGFTTVSNLKKHLDLHTSIKKHKCQPCGKSFAQVASLRWHRKTKHE